MVNRSIEDAGGTGPIHVASIFLVGSSCSEGLERILEGYLSPPVCFSSLRVLVVPLSDLSEIIEARKNKGRSRSHL